MSVADKLLLLNSTKTAIAVAIEDKGVTVGAIPFSQYPAKIAEITGGGAGGWTRPADWLPLPEVTSSEQKMVGLYSVDDDDSNFIAILAEGAYTVDWGDGVVENFTSGVMAEHQYNFASLPAGSLSIRGYKQVLVTLTPQAGQNITKLDMNQRPTGFGSVQRTLQWLDVTISVPNGTSLAVVGASTNARMSMLERCAIVTAGSVTDMSSMFNNCFSLQSVPLFDTSSATNVGSMFSGCRILQSVPLFDTTSVTDMSSMFSGCFGLQSVPLFDTTSVTDMSSMFSNCRILQSVPPLDTSVVTDMSSMFNNCFSLQSVPPLDTTSVTDMSSMFSNCSGLQSAPLFDTSAVTIISSMFSGCASLQSVPLFDTSAVTIISSMFSGCASLQSAPLFDTSSVTDMSNMFSNCSALGRSRVLGTKITHTYIGCNMSASALNEVFTNLATVAGQTITITNNPGAATCDRTIATAKGWTVTG